MSADGQSRFGQTVIRLGSEPAAEWQELRQSKLPLFGADRTGRLPLGALYALLADGDIERYQEAMDALLLPRLG